MYVYILYIYVQVYIYMCVYIQYTISIQSRLLGNCKRCVRVVMATLCSDLYIKCLYIYTYTCT